MNRPLLHHRAEGSPTAPPLLLGPSLGTSLALWDQVAPELSVAHRVVRWDLPGHGGSAPGLISAGATVGELAGLVLALADDLGIERFAYAGVSLGGAVGLHLAVHHPERVGALAVLCSSAHFGGAGAWQERAALVRKEGTAGVADSAPARWFTPGFSVPRLVRDNRDADPEAYAACCDALAAFDLRERLGDIAVPTLLIAGRDDPATPPAHLREIADAVPGAELAELFNSSYRPDNPVHDTAFHAAYLAPVVAAGGDLVDSFSYWTFSDMFEEEGVPTALFHGGFGLLTHRQVKKPTYHLYAFMARMGEEVLGRGDDHLVTRHPDGRVTVLAWAPVDPTGVAPGPGLHTLRLHVPLSGGTAFLRRSSVDEERGNAYTAWRRMGSPRSPRPRQVDVLHEAAEPARSHHRLPVGELGVTVDLTLERHEVTLVEVSPVEDETPAWWDAGRLLGDGEPR
ncbi:alpha/beta fold hydrolase [Streptomyces sp. SID8379]|uniref:alpha/beta fold hydrolase n=1 Tax=unclassified Streptomyces TaxID=2593676 RepID=UPI00039C6458|nr:MULTISPECIES: alpha/beta fold hydrolase [unclassified Streptomyces]MYW62749.1 alpha/beta fold hydrolase [Streptomyces sp. SID8379]